MEWEHITTERVFRFSLWETGGTFLKKYPFYQGQLLKEANLIFYFLSLDSLQPDTLLERLGALITETR